MLGNRDLMVHKTATNPLSLQLNHCGIQECLIGQRHGFYMRPYQLIHFVLEGSGTLVLKEKSYPVQAGQAFFIPAGTTAYYYASDENPWKYTWLGFFAEPDNLFVDLLFHQQYVIDIHLSLRELEHLALSIIEVTDPRAGQINYYRKEDFPGEQFFPITTLEQSLEANSRMLHLFSRLLCTQCPGPSYRAKDKNYAEDIKAFIDSYYCESVKIQDVADAMHIHPNYMSAVFKKAYGQTPKSYLSALRMERARQMLNGTDHPVSLIASSVGMDNPFQFSSAFKKYFGISPSNYRKAKKQPE